MRFPTLRAVLMVVSVPLLVAAAPADPKVTLEQRLQARYPPTRLAGDKLHIAQPGTVLVLRQGGLFASPLDEFAFANNYKDGHIKRSAASALIHNTNTSRELFPGDKVYLLKTEAKDSGVVFSLQSCRACDGAEVDLYEPAFRASLTFQFPKGYAETTDFGQIQRAIDDVFDLAFTDHGNTPAPPADPEPRAQPAPSPEPVRIALGQSIEEVRSNLGQPDKIVDLGSKKIYYYRDMKIVFVDGRVSDVQ